MNLIQLALAAEGFFQHQPNIRFSDTQCIRSKNTQAGCHLCVESCPTNAVILESGIPEIDIESCIKCGICLHTCPVGAFERADGIYDLLNCAESLVNHEILDIACIHHPTAENTERKVDAVIQTGNCLSELGPSAYIGLKAVGVKHIRIRQDTCSNCPLCILQPQIEQSVNQAQQILSTLGLDNELIIVTDVKTARHKKAVYQSKRPPVSRRELFLMFTAQRRSNARIIADNSEEQPTGDKHTSRERQRLLNALNILTKAGANVATDVTLQNDHFAQFAIQKTCTACGLCERACPVGAIKVEKTQTKFTINFAPHLCINCGLCVEYCEPEALEFIGGPSARDVIDGVVMQLHTDILHQCKRCKSLFAGQMDETLCPTCQQRHKTPASTSLSKAMLAKLPEETRKRLNQHLGRTVDKNT